MRSAVLMFTLVLMLSAAALGLQKANFASAQAPEIITIKNDGNIDGTDKIQRNGAFYVFTGNVSGNIKVQKSNIIIDGAGFTLNGNNGTGIEISSETNEHPSELDIWNVTVKNLRITIPYRHRI